ncbi:MAG: DUF2721 domain-containing protein [Spirochaetota bacterium]
MTLNLTTPALLFPAISLLMLAYTNRFLALAALIRGLAVEYSSEKDVRILKQIHNLRMRLRLIRMMQASGIFSLFLCVLCMLLLFLALVVMAKYIFAISLCLLLLSLGLSFWEIQISIQALELNLEDLQKK